MKGSGFFTQGTSATPNSEADELEGAGGRSQAANTAPNPPHGKDLHEVAARYLFSPGTLDERSQLASGEWNLCALVGGWIGHGQQDG